MLGWFLAVTRWQQRFVLQKFLSSCNCHWSQKDLAPSRSVCSRIPGLGEIWRIRFGISGKIRYSRVSFLSPTLGRDPQASYCEEFLRQYTCWLLRSHSSQQPAKTLPEKHPQQPRPTNQPSVLSAGSSPVIAAPFHLGMQPCFSCPALWRSGVFIT